MKKICIDTGHVPGANKSPCVPGYSEGTQMAALGEMLAALLVEYYDDAEVFFTREDITDDVDVVKRGRAARGADLFISLHSNASNNTKCDNINFVYVLYPYDGINDSARIAGELADAAECALYGHGVNMSPWRIDTRQGANGDWYGVMRGARQVGVPLYFIIEHGFHTNEANALTLLEPAALADLALSETLAIGEVLMLHRREFIPGDVNGNGKIDPQDYAMLKRYLLGTYELTVAQKIRADISGDGHLTAKDYAMIKRKVLGTL